MASGGFENLYSLARQALAEIEQRKDDTKVTNEAKVKLRGLIAAERKVWQEFLTAAKLKAGTRSGADACLQDLRTAAANVRRDPELHADIVGFLEHLTCQTIELEQAYHDYKTERGLVDFSDLEVLFLKLLDDQTIVSSLREEFALVVVDEFQDTNPVQLAIFQRLRELAPESHWVGDPNQAIFGFRGTDPQLIRDIG